MLELYITHSKSIPSRSGLYANGLPGVTLSLLDDLTKDEQEDYEEFWDDIYQRSITNFISDVQAKLADKFFVDLKLVSRETSAFKDDLNVNSGLAGIKLTYYLPRYGRLNINTIQVFSDSEQADKEIYFYDTDENGTLLYTQIVDLEEGLNTIHVDEYFSVDKLFIAFETSEISIRETKNRYFDQYRYISFSDLSCIYGCYRSRDKASIDQVNGGGINVIFNAICSIDRFVEQNINIFKDAFWYRIGLELLRERIFSDRFNRWTTMTAEDAESKQASYASECEIKLNNAVRSLRMNEDPVCFACKSPVTSVYIHG